MPEYESWEEDKKLVAELNRKMKEIQENTPYQDTGSRFVGTIHGITFITMEELMKNKESREALRIHRREERRKRLEK